MEANTTYVNCVAVVELEICYDEYAESLDLGGAADNGII